MCSLSAVQCLSKNSQESQVTSPVKINCDVPLSRKNLRRAGLHRARNGDFGK